MCVPATPARRRHLLIVAGVLLVLLAGAVALGVLDAGQDQPSSPETLADAAAQPADEPTSMDVATGIPPREAAPQPEPATVLDPAAPRRDPAFDGRAARWLGKVTRGDRGVAAQLVVMAGMNRGTEIQCDADGSFDRSGLYPGFARFEVREAGRVVAERVAVLRARVPAELTLDLTPQGTMQGTVVGEDGVPLAGATVACDGVSVTTGTDGSFALPRTADGPARARFSRRGYAPLERNAWRTSSPKVALRRGGSLEIVIPSLAGPTDVQVYVVPTSDRPRAFPWNRLNPWRARAGERLHLDDLPADDVEVRVFAAFAVSAPLAARIRPSAPAVVVVEWQELPLLRGTVVDGGRPVAGAEVWFEAVDAHQAISVALGTARSQLRSLPFETLPAVRQRTRTDRDGRFRLALPELVRSGAWLDIHAAGREPVRRRVSGDVEAIEVDVAR